MNIASLLLLGLTWSAASSASAQELSVPLPASVQYGGCRPINVSPAEMAKQWTLYYSHASGLRRDAQSTDYEASSMEKSAMTPSMLECYKGSKLFALMCFSRSTTTRLSIQTIKLMHAESGGDCLTITNVALRK